MFYQSGRGTVNTRSRTSFEHFAMIQDLETTRVNILEILPRSEIFHLQHLHWQKETTLQQTRIMENYEKLSFFGQE
jgi:hypothetical protein